MSAGKLKNSRSAGKAGVPVFVEGVRSPFVKSFGAYDGIDCLGLFSRTVAALLRKTGIDPHAVDEIAAGVVVPQPKNPNVARDAVINLNLPHRIHGSTTNRACTSSLHTIATAAATIGSGQPLVVLAGGVEMLSNVPVVYSEKATEFLVKISRARGNVARLRLLSQLSPRDWIPRPPSLLEPLTGFTMGEHAEQMAKLNGIARAEQDEYALASHRRASAARKAGKFDAETCPIWAGSDYSKVITADNIIRDDADLASLQRLRPVFDRRYGSITAGSSSPLTDGAAVTMIADARRVHDLGLVARAKILDFLFVGVDPYRQLLIGPAVVIPQILRRNKLVLKDIDLVEIHEAFAAQVLSCQRALASADFAAEHLGNSKPCGEIPADKLNVNGGAIAIGHPFGASGARLVITLSNELQRRDKTLGLVAICAAGGMGGAMLIERLT